MRDRDARYTGTVKILVSIIFQTVQYYNFAHFGFHMLLFRSSPVDCSAYQIAAKPVNLTTELCDGSNTDETLLTCPKLTNK